MYYAKLAEITRHPLRWWITSSQTNPPALRESGNMHKQLAHRREMLSLYTHAKLLLANLRILHIHAGCCGTDAFKLQSASLSLYILAVISNFRTARLVKNAGRGRRTYCDAKCMVGAAKCKCWVLVYLRSWPAPFCSGGSSLLSNSAGSDKSCQ